MMGTFFNNGGGAMVEPVRISPEETRTRVLSGAAILVCAYDDDEKFKINQLEGAISFKEFSKRSTSLSRDLEIIFYCA
jgi:hypothetical protein